MHLAFDVPWVGSAMGGVTGVLLLELLVVAECRLAHQHVFTFILALLTDGVDGPQVLRDRKLYARACRLDLRAQGKVGRLAGANGIRIGAHGQNILGLETTDHAYLLTPITKR